MSEYQEFTGKSVEEALRNAREAFGVGGLDDLDFEILTPGSRGVLGMGAEPARVLAAPRSALGGAAPRREAAAATPLPPPPSRPEREGGFRDREGGFRDRGDRRRPDAATRGDRAERAARPSEGETPAATDAPGEAARREGRGDRRAERVPGARPGRAEGRGRDAGRRPGGRSESPPALTESEQEELASAVRSPLGVEREEIQAADASPEALAAGKEILESLMRHMGYEVTVEIRTGDTSKLDVRGAAHEKEALGALIGRKGERLSALQHLLNLMLSRRMGSWTRVLVDVEDYRGRRERQLHELAQRAADRVVESGKMLQLEAMPALERRWVHLALRDHGGVMTQSIGEEPNRRVVVLRREG